MKIKKEFLLLTVSIIVAVCCAEVLAQAVFRLRNGYWLFSKETFRIGYAIPVKDRRQYSLRPGYSDEKKSIHINEFGFRGPVIPFDSKRIGVALGDSIPFGIYVKDTQSYPYLLDELMVKNGSGARVLNAGVPSYNLRQSFDRFKYDVAGRYRAISWATVQAANDISLFIQYKERYGPDLTWADAKLKRTWSWFGILKRNSALCQYLDTDLRSLSRKQKNHFPPDKMIKNVENTLDEYLKFFSDKGIAVILLPADPFYYQLKDTDKNGALSRWQLYKRNIMNWRGIIDPFNEALREAAESGRYKNVYFFDTREIMDREDRDKMYMDFIHYSPEGNRLVAEGLYRFLSDKGLIES